MLFVNKNRILPLCNTLRMRGGKEGDFREAKMGDITEGYALFL